MGACGFLPRCLSLSFTHSRSLTQSLPLCIAAASKSNTVLWAVLGSVAALALLILLVLVVRRRQRRDLAYAEIEDMRGSRATAETDAIARRAMSTSYSKMAE
jgi:uncharacterized membrane protein